MPTLFLTWGGCLLFVLGIFGYLFGDGKLLGGQLSLTATENIIHTVTGILALLAVGYTPATIKKWLSVVIGLMLVGLALWGLWPQGSFESSLLIDIFRLIVGGAALWAGVTARRS